jgi:mannose-1-phosphate guanylyltransferase
VLAGGEGQRLRSFVHLLRRDLLPKQYVNFIGRRSMLEHTLHRAERLVPSNSVFTVVNKGHLIFPEVRQQLADRYPDTVLVQPENKETASGVLFSLIHIATRFPNSIVTLLPSDHFILEEDQVVRYLAFAQRWVKCDSSRLVLLGIEPDREESEHGYIVPGARVKRGENPVLRISSFVENPDRRTAEQLSRRGALWNTMMMVFDTATLLNLIKDLSPALFAAFQPLFRAIGTAEEKSVTAEIYRGLKPVNFSKEILEPMARQSTGKLLTLQIRNVLWSEWGSESRIMETLRTTGHASRLNGLPKAPYTSAVAENQDHSFIRQVEPSPLAGRKWSPGP